MICGCASSHLSYYDGPKKQNSEVALYLPILAESFTSDTIVYTEEIDGKNILRFTCKDGPQLTAAGCPTVLGFLPKTYKLKLDVLNYDNALLPMWLKEKKLDVNYELNFSPSIGYIYGPKLLKDEQYGYKVCIAKANSIDGVGGVRDSKELVACSVPKVIGDNTVLCKDANLIGVTPSLVAIGVKTNNECYERPSK